MHLPTTFHVALPHKHHTRTRHSDAEKKNSICRVLTSGPLPANLFRDLSDEGKKRPKLLKLCSPTAYSGHHARTTGCERMPSERVRDIRVAAGRLGLHVVRPG